MKLTLVANLIRAKSGNVEPEPSHFSCLMTSSTSCSYLFKFVLIPLEEIGKSFTPMYALMTSLGSYLKKYTCVLMCIWYLLEANHSLNCGLPLFFLTDSHSKSLSDLSQTSCACALIVWLDRAHVILK